MRVSVVLIFCLLLGTFKFTFGQVSDHEKSYTFPKIMLIPYHPTNFESDVNLSGKMFRKRPRGFINVNANDHFRKNLDKALFDNLLTYFDVNRISYYQTKQAKADLNRIYSSISYTQQHQRVKQYYKNYQNFDVFQILDSYKWGIDCIEQKRGKPVKRLKKLSYTDITINDPNLIQHLDKQYSCSYYLFVNKVDLYSRFKICSDLLKNVQQKDIVLHFTLLDHTGERVTGGLVAVTYNPINGRNNILEIVEKNMEILASLVRDDIEQELGLSLRYF